MKIHFRRPMILRAARLLIFIIIALAEIPRAAPVDSLDSWLGVQFPYVKEILPDSFPDLLIRNAVYEQGGVKSWLWLNPDDSLPYVLYPTEGELLFYLSRDGIVDSVQLIKAGMRNFISRYRRSLQNLKFQPAVYGGEAIPFILPAHLLIKPPRGGFLAILTFPYDPRIEFRSRPLIEEALRRNGFTLPGVKYFPPYFCPFKIKERLGNYPYVVFAVNLDSSGNPTEIIEHCRTYRDFSATISRVLLNAEFLPATYKGEAISSQFYLLIRYFENLQYPTTAWPPLDNSSPLFPFDYLRIDNLLFPDSILNPPIPLNMPGGQFWRRNIFSVNDSVRVLVRIDTLGEIVSNSPVYPLFPRYKSELDTLLEGLVFTPARDIWDKKVVFDGEIMLWLGYSENIRIQALWWPKEAQPGALLTD